MKKDLQRQISEDLNIHKFNNESESEFSQRLIYSAAAMWVKTLVYGNSLKDLRDEKVVKFPDIMYVQTHLKKVLETYLKCFDVNQDWLEVDKKDEMEVDSGLAGEIIQEMIYTLEIGKINGRELCAVPVKYVKHGRWNKVYGNRSFSDEICSVGVSQWTMANIENSFTDISRIITVDGVNYYNEMVKKFPWKRIELNSTYDIFKVGSLNRYSKCWIQYKSDRLAQGIHLLRESNQFDPGYLLIMKKDEEILVTTLDPWYSKTKEIYRIMYALNEQNGTKAQFRVKDYGEYMVFYYASALPDYENRIIHSLSWPYRDYADNCARIIPSTFWDVVEQLIKSIGVEIMYK